MNNSAVQVGNADKGLVILIGISTGALVKDKTLKFFRCCVLSDGILKQMHGFSLFHVSNSRPLHHFIDVRHLARDIAKFIHEKYKKQTFTVVNGREITLGFQDHSVMFLASKCEPFPDELSHHFSRALRQQFKRLKRGRADD